MTSVLTKHQKKVYGPRPISGWGKNSQIRATVRYDDPCGNGHNSFFEDYLTKLIQTCNLFLTIDCPIC
jgi:hypothetical protein